MSRAFLQVVQLFSFAMLLLAVATAHTTAAASNLRVDNGKGGQTDVRFLVVNNMVTNGWCVMAISALMTGINVVTLGYEQPYSHTTRLEKMITYAEAEGLSDDAVLVTFDGSDVVFAGNSPIKFVKDFVHNSPASKKELDAFAIHRSLSGDGVALPPVLFSGEVNCMLQQVTPKAFCSIMYDEIETMLSVADPEYKANVRGVLSSYRFLNAGGMVVRVWAVKALKAAYDHFEKRKEPMRRSYWFCDQSAYGAMFFQQQRRLAEALMDAPSIRSEQPWLGDSPLSSDVLLPHFTPLGLIGVNLVSDFLFAPFYSKVGEEVCVSEIAPSIAESSPMAAFQKRHHRLRMQYVYVCPRPLYKLKNITERVFPAALHFPGLKRAKGIFSSYIQYLGWYPRNADEVATLKELLADATLELWSGSTKKEAAVKDVCFPFLDKMIHSDG